MDRGAGEQLQFVFWDFLGRHWVAALFAVATGAVFSGVGRFGSLYERHESPTRPQFSCLFLQLVIVFIVWARGAVLGGLMIVKRAEGGKALCDEALSVCEPCLVRVSDVTKFQSLIIYSTVVAE